MQRYSMRFENGKLVKFWTITLPAGYDPRETPPYEGAINYVTDGTRYGIEYRDSGIDWLGTSIIEAFGEPA